MSDLRTRRTLAAIQRNMYTLLNQQPFSAINVSMICRQTGITRSTYYQYYLDKNDWLEREVGRLILIVERNLPDEIGQLDALVKALSPEAKQVELLLTIHDPAGDLSAQLKQLFIKQCVAEDAYHAGLYADIALRTLSWRLAHPGDVQPVFEKLVALLRQNKTH
ncbi:TetR/AcrR family transcriptional regulator [Lacticaseibacillus sp. GG6-2]